MTASPLIIEKANPEDAKAILRLKRAAWLNAYPNKKHGITVEDIDKKLPESILPEAIINWQKGIANEKIDGDRVTFIARLSSKVVGYTAPCTEDGQKRVGALYVAPDMQGVGIGKKLLQQCVDWHGRQEDIYLHVVSYNTKAIGFYEHFGFEKTGVETPEEYDEKENIKLLPELEMVLRAHKTDKER